MHAYLKEDKWVFVPADEYEAQKHTLPDICVAFKCPIQNMDKAFSEHKSFLQMDSKMALGGESQVSSLSGKKVQDVVYSTHVKLGTEDVKVTLSELEYNKETTHFDTNPLIFFRLKKPLLTSQKLPIIDLKNAYNTTSKFGFEFEVTPDFSYQANSKLLSQTVDSYKEFCQQLDKYPQGADQIKADEELREQMSKQIASDCPENLELKHIEKFKVKDMKFKDEKDHGSGLLSKVPASVIEKRVNLIWHFNYFFFSIQNLVVTKLTKGFRGQKVSNTSAANMLAKSKSMILTAVLLKFVNKKIEALPQGSGHQSITLDRPKAFNFEETGKVDHTGEYTLFGQSLQAS
jgi:hypothetical protein